MKPNHSDASRSEFLTCFNQSRMENNVRGSWIFNCPMPIKASYQNCQKKCPVINQQVISGLNFKTTNPPDSKPILLLTILFPLRTDVLEVKPHGVRILRRLEARLTEEKELHTGASIANISPNSPCSTIITASLMKGCFGWFIEVLFITIFLTP